MIRSSPLTVKFVCMCVCVKKIQCIDSIVILICVATSKNTWIKTVLTRMFLIQIKRQPRMFVNTLYTCLVCPNNNSTQFTIIHSISRRQAKKNNERVNPPYTNTTWRGEGSRTVLFLVSSRADSANSLYETEETLNENL